jgi:(p)ppGpp synthase/HD superfamily hydrolase
LSDARQMIEAFQKEAKKEIELALKDTGVNYQIDFRVKSVYSIYKKMKRK